MRRWGRRKRREDRRKDRGLYCTMRDLRYGEVIRGCLDSMAVICIPCIGIQTVVTAFLQPFGLMQCLVLIKVYVA